MEKENEKKKERKQYKAHFAIKAVFDISALPWMRHSFTLHTRQ
jgi:hypothetical protein